jgi:hypothetical protein
MFSRFGVEYGSASVFMLSEHKTKTKKASKLVVHVADRLLRLIVGRERIHEWIFGFFLAPVATVIKSVYDAMSEHAHSEKREAISGRLHHLFLHRELSRHGIAWLPFPFSCLR